MSTKGRTRFDVFIAYAKADYATAKAVYDRVSRFAQVFLDEQTLRPGDKWDEITPVALQNSSLIAVFISPHLDATHYLRSEILQAISVSRRSPDKVSIVPILLSESPNQLPYGLERHHCLDYTKLGEVGVAQELFGFLFERRNRHLEAISSPAYASAEQKAISDQLQDSVKRLKSLRAADAPQRVLAGIEKEIDELRRRIRIGGQLRPGDLLGDRYLMLERIGSGGFGHVWLALDQINGTKVAVKVLRSDLMSDYVAVERFARGALAVEGRSHPNICAILSTEGLLRSDDESEDKGHADFSFYVMEYIGAGDLRSRVIAGKLSPELALSIIVQVGQGLAFAHQHGIVHRDIKPENILLTEDGVAKITDFDLSMLDGGTLQSATAGLGTFIYAAPEQQIASKNVGPKADIYSLGMTAIFVFHGDPLPLEVVRNTGSFIDTLPCVEAAKKVLRRAVEWDQGDRYDSASDFLADLQDAWTSPVSSHPVLVVARLIPDIDIELVHVPAGAFLMGNDGNEESRPVRRVSISELWIGRFPVTNSQYCRFLDDTRHQAPAFRDNSLLNGPTQPVIGVSFRDAQLFCEWLAGVLGRAAPDWWSKESKIRLPSEAEWEYIARGGGCRTYPWGFSTPSHNLANYDNFVGATTSVGNYPEGASWTSAQDIAGNVWEWCEDTWHPNYVDAPLDGTAWTSGDETIRVVRGGSYLFGEKGLCGYYRYWWPAGKRHGNQGFRVAVSGISKIGLPGIESK